MEMGLSTRTQTPAPGPACTPQVRCLEVGSWRRWSLRCTWLTPSCYFTGSLSSRFSEPPLDQGPGAGIPSALVLISIV